MSLMNLFTQEAAHLRLPIAAKADLERSGFPHLQLGQRSATRTRTVLPFFLFLMVMYLPHLLPPLYWEDGRAMT